MQETKNYQLNQWEPTDEVRREDFNNDNAAIDAALKAVADTAESKAGAEDVSALQQSVNSQIAALSTALGSGGSNCRIAWGSYTGTGTYGKNTPTKLTFDFNPMLVFVASDSGGGEAHFIRPTTQNSGTNYGNLSATWTENGVSWYSSGTYPNAHDQYNYETYVYHYLAFGVAA